MLWSTLRISLLFAIGSALLATIGCGRGEQVPPSDPPADAAMAYRFYFKP